LPLDLERLKEGTNPFSTAILAQLENEPGKAWLAFAWRQFLFWFADAEARLTDGTLDVDLLLRAAKKNWQVLEDSNVLMEEARNDGSWIRPWRRALLEFQR
jgi:hypothetical protein